MCDGHVDLCIRVGSGPGNLPGRDVIVVYRAIGQRWPAT